MKREPHLSAQLSALLLCVGLALLAFLMSVSSAGAHANTGTNVQTNNGGGDDDDDRGAFAVKQGPGTNTGNCPARPRPTDAVVFPKVYCPYPPGLIPSDLTTESERVRRAVR